MSSIIKGFCDCWENNREYGVKLTEDLADDAWIGQPEGLVGKPMNHPAWAMCHMNVYLPVIAAVIQGKPFDDPRDHAYGMQSHPELDRQRYPEKGMILETWNQGHHEVAELLKAADVTVFERPILLERWKTRFASAGQLLPYLMLNHENTHLGQISAWRRALGLPSV